MLLLLIFAAIVIKDPYLRKSSPYWYEVDLITSRATLYNLWKHGERSVAWEIRCLKLVEIRGLEGSFDELCFLRHLLEYGMVLEKLIIYPSKEWLRHPNRRLDSFIKETLLSFPRASSTVEILMLF
ncbi:hypothetical protein C5167_045699 [Papaver somniferum]|uniref:FBD domain-containing protein n=1 Tax=Papaver somniferum TaxID=3469 RepID=A0A4Y7LFC7_PAPSO|nr:hypothetical protein C5167_045699 [Papaver somniferum]